MSHTDLPLEPFDLARVLSDAVEIFRLGFRPVAVIMCSEALIDLAITTAIDFVPLGKTSVPVEIALLLLTYSFAFATATRVLNNVGYGLAPDLRGAFHEANAKIKPIFLAGFGTTIGLTVAIMFLIAPGIWLAGVWAVVFPVLMIENTGLKAFTRSADLTRGYRWQAAGATLLIMIPSAVASYVFTAVLGALPFSANTGMIGDILDFTFTTFLHVIVGGSLVAVSVSTYKRLIDLKETADPDGIADVFD